METINQNPTPEELSERERVLSTIESLMNGENNHKIIENIKMYYDAGRGSRISIFHENITNSDRTMVMSSTVYEKMNSLTQETARTKEEHAFLALGWIQDDTYFFTQIVDDTEIDDEMKHRFYNEHPEFKTDDSAADFNIMLALFQEGINGHIDNVKKSNMKPLISLGHTHPNVSESYGNYSLPDLVGISAQKESIKGDRDETEFEYCHVILPENGDVDCMTFNPTENRFEKITTVLSFGQEEVNEIPAYTFKSPESLSEASYSKEANESAEDNLYNECIEEITQKHQWDNIH